MFLAENKIFSFFACACIRLILFLLFHKHCLTVLGNDSYIIFDMISNTTQRHTDTHTLMSHSDSALDAEMFYSLLPFRRLLI